MPINLGGDCGLNFWGVLGRTMQLSYAWAGIFDDLLPSCVSAVGLSNRFSFKLPNFPWSKSFLLPSFCIPMELTVQRPRFLIHYSFPVIFPDQPTANYVPGAIVGFALRCSIESDDAVFLLVDER
jgi:hypothetical protein